MTATPKEYLTDAQAFAASAELCEFIETLTNHPNEAMALLIIASGRIAARTAMPGLTMDDVWKQLHVTGLASHRDLWEWAFTNEQAAQEAEATDEQSTG
jgi:hypothetical protein